MDKRIRDKQTHIESRPARCPACNMTSLENDGEGPYCPNCLYTPSPRITLEDAVAKAEAVAVAESRALRDELAREHPHTHRRRAA